MGRRHVTSDRRYVEDSQKIEKSTIEADQRSLSFNNGGDHIIDNHFLGRSPEIGKRI